VANKPVLFRVIEPSATPASTTSASSWAIPPRDPGSGGHRPALERQDHLHPAGPTPGPGPRRQGQPGFPGRRPVCDVPGRQCHRGRHLGPHQRVRDLGLQLPDRPDAGREPLAYGVAELDSETPSASSAWWKSRATRPATWSWWASICSTSTSGRRWTPSSPPGAASWRSPMPSSTWWTRLQRAPLHPPGLVDRHRRAGRHAGGQRPGPGRDRAQHRWLRRPRFAGQRQGDHREGGRDHQQPHPGTGHHRRGQRAS
jgi:hypothetical protein